MLIGIFLEATLLHTTARETADEESVVRERRSLLRNECINFGVGGALNGPSASARRKNESFLRSKRGFHEGRPFWTISKEKPLRFTSALSSGKKRNACKSGALWSVDLANPVE